MLEAAMRRAMRVRMGAAGEVAVWRSEGTEALNPCVVNRDLKLLRGAMRAARSL